MSINDNLPYCDYCGLPYKDGSPTCDCESWLAGEQEDRDDEAVVEHCSKQKSNCS